MSDQVPGWFSAAVTAGIAIIAAVWAFVKRFLSMPSREEFKEAHQTNTTLLNDILSRLTNVEVDVSYIKGRMDEKDKS